MKSITGYIHHSEDYSFLFGTRNNKFTEEKVNFENENWIVLFDGILLNRQEIKLKFNCESNCDILIKLFQEYGPEMVFHAKGSYSLAIMDKKSKKVLITNDLLSKHPMYYKIDNNKIYYSGSFYDLLNILSENKCHIQINADATDHIMHYGYFNKSDTYVSGMYYLNAFESIIVDLNTQNISVVKHNIKKINIPENMEDIIQKFDELFTNAVNLQFKKNIEYGYMQAATISGGMDSRSCLLKAIQNGYDSDIFCFCYAQSGSLDFQISQKIAIDYNLDYVFYPMDKALFLKKLSRAMELNECQQPSVGSTGAISMSGILDTSKFGILNIGICGGELMGDLIKIKTHSSTKQSFFNKACNFIKKSFSTTNEFIYSNDDLLNQLRACQNFTSMFSDKCEALSPYMDEDVFMFVSQINPKYLFKRKMYIRWMKEYIPNPYIVTHTFCPIGASPAKIALKKTGYYITKKIFGKSKGEMNPFDYWFNTIPEYKDLFNSEFLSLCTSVYESGNKDIADIAKKEWSQNWRKNSFVLTALNAINKINKIF